MQWPIEMTTRPLTRVKIERFHGKFEVEGTVQDMKNNRSVEAQCIKQSFFFRWDVTTVHNDHPNIRPAMCSRDRHWQGQCRPRTLFEKGNVFIPKLLCAMNKDPIDGGVQLQICVLI
jgi:hypothetical protein